MNNESFNDREAGSRENLSSCGCCAGAEKLTPRATANRPGLGSLSYRVGTHAAFFETMQARLAGFWIDIPRERQSPGALPQFDRIYPLTGLTSRDKNDPAIALLDAWSMVGDVLTFYQERIANEGYLRTATERRSLVELARLIGYTPRPGVAASVHLALTLEKDSEIVLKPYELRAQSIPGPNELPQTFENGEELDARQAWNNLGPRLTRPQKKETIVGDGTRTNRARVYLQGVATNLKINDPLLVEFGEELPELFRVVEVEPDPRFERTRVGLQLWIAKTQFRGASNRAELAELIDRLSDKIALYGSGVTVDRTSKLLAGLRARIDAQVEDLELVKHLTDDVLVELHKREATLPPSSTTVRPLLIEVIGELDAAASELARASSANTPAAGKPAAIAAETDPQAIAQFSIESAIDGLVKRPSVPPRNTLNLARNIKTHFSANADTGLQVLSAFQPSLREAIGPAIANIPIEETPVRVYALRVRAQPFGHNAPPRTKYVVRDADDEEGKRLVDFFEWGEEDVIKAEDPSENTIFLNAAYEKILAGSWIVVDTSQIIPKKTSAVKVGPESPLLFARVGEANASVSRSAYGMSGPTTRIELADRKDPHKPLPWIDIDSAKEKMREFEIIRRTVVYAQSEELSLAEEPIETDICRGSQNGYELELNGLYNELKSGRWMIFSGERADIKDSSSGASIPGINGNELVMVSAVHHRFDPELPGDRIHTFIELASDLQYCYKRNSVTIYANVVKATHGETGNEILGSGDATTAFQSFNLRQAPLTYVASPTPAGAESTLQVFVNDVRWKETDPLADASPADRKFVTYTADAGKTTVIFGDGRHVSRLPTGVENVRAIYRSGIGVCGNVRDGQISVLMTRPLGIKDVINPIRASGGADREDSDQVRKNAPLTVTALDRLISTEDYADFARTFAGIGKSVAARFSDGHRELVHVTIAGVDNIPIDESSDLFRNLRLAMREFGDPFQPFRVELRESKFLVISARLQIHLDYLWDRVVTKVRAKLLGEFSFARREIGQDALLGEVIGVMQSVKGVEYVDVDIFGGLPEKKVEGKVRRLLTPEEVLSKVRDLKGAEPRVRANLAGISNGVIHPAELAYLTPEVPGTLILNRI
jgi:predicted phage baseplate assembly protein